MLNQPAQPVVGAMRDTPGQRLEVFDGQRWIPLDPNPTLNPDLAQSLTQSLTQRIHACFRAAGIPEREARFFLEDLRSHNLEIVEGPRGTVSEVVEVKESDFDFTDVCTACAEATDWYEMWNSGSKASEAPDRFCIFHHGYVMGAVSQKI